MQPDLTQRIGPDWQAQLRGWRAADQPLWIISDRWRVSWPLCANLERGLREALCTLFYDDPAFVEEMMEADRALHHLR